MKIMISILVVLVLAASSWAGVLIECSASGNDVTISYDRNGESERIRAFALDVTVDSGTITGYSNPHPDYDIYPGSIEIDAGGTVTDPGSPIADATEYPSGTCPGLNDTCVTIEMGSLYAQGETPPPDTGDLITLTVSGPCNVSMTENVIRGGVVMEDPTVPANPAFTGCQVGAECKGDSDGNQVVDTDDMNNLLLHLFVNGQGQDKWLSPIGPYPLLDIDDSGGLDTDDMNLLLLHLFTNGQGQDKWASPCM
jgi:hypothetical protein